MVDPDETFEQQLTRLQNAAQQAQHERLRRLSGLKLSAPVPRPVPAKKEKRA